MSNLRAKRGDNATRNASSDGRRKRGSGAKNGSDLNDNKNNNNSMSNSSSSTISKSSNSAEYVRKFNNSQRSMQCIGVRTIALLYGLVPCILMLIILPFYAIHIGDIKQPDVLLSDIAALGEEAHLPYAGMLNFGLCMFATISMFCIGQYTMFTQQQHEGAGFASGLILTIVVFGVVPNLFLLLGFNFKEGEMHSNVNTLEGIAQKTAEHNLDDMFYSYIVGASWNEIIPWFIHVFSATMVFISIGLCAFLFTILIEPVAKTGKLEPMEDVSAKRFWTRATAASLPLGLVLRMLHIIHSRHVWAIPLLLWEMWILLAACGCILHGFLRTMMMLDYQQPILSCRGFLYLIKSVFSGGLSIHEIEEFSINDEGPNYRERDSTTSVKND